MLDLLQVVGNASTNGRRSSLAMWKASRTVVHHARHAMRGDVMRPGSPSQGRLVDVLIVEFGVDRASPANTTIGRRPQPRPGSAVINWVTPGPHVTEATATLPVATL